jgi:hypothetical protein
LAVELARSGLAADQLETLKRPEGNEGSGNEISAAVVKRTGQSVNTCNSNEHAGLNGDLIRRPYKSDNSPLGAEAQKRASMRIISALYFVEHP